MKSWQRRVRIALAIFMVAFAAVVYVSIRARQTPPPPQTITRLDPKALAETTRATGEQIQGTEQQFQITSARSLSYEDGSLRHQEVEITVRRPGDRVYVIRAKEGLAGPNQQDFELKGDVVLSVNDGFELRTGHGTFSRADSTARADGDVSFRRGRMSGSGIGATYDEANDVLRINKDAHVVVSDGAGGTSLEGRGDEVAIDRRSGALFFESGVHVVRGKQIIDADHGMARLSSDEEVVNYLELRGHARVRGGDSQIESMHADAVDLDYTEDGATLERVILNHEASVSTSAGDGPGWKMDSEALDVRLREDGSISELAARDGVLFDLTGAGDVPARRIRAKTLDALGKPGEGLTEAHFREQVEFEEIGGTGAAGRHVRASALDALLVGQDVVSSVFTGSVTFADGDLHANAEEARYRPGQDRLNLAGASPRDVVSVSDEHIRVDANTIDVSLEAHAMQAHGGVRTTWGARDRPAATADEAGRLPGLLRQNEPTSVNAESLDYSGSKGRAVYDGGVALVQGDTAIRADNLVIDRERGDLIARGAARSTLVLDAGRTDGRGEEIRYEDASRVVTYSGTPVPPRSGEGGPASSRAADRASRAAQVTGPDGDLRADRIRIVLARDANAVDRLEAFTDVVMTLESRTANGDRLTYYAQDGKYVMAGTPAMPVTLRESCRETTGQTVTFFKSSDRLIVDGNEIGRTETKPCAAPSTR